MKKHKSKLILFSTFILGTLVSSSILASCSSNNTQTEVPIKPSVETEVNNINNSISKFELSKPKYSQSEIKNLNADNILENLNNLEIKEDFTYKAINFSNDLNNKIINFNIEISYKNDVELSKSITLKYEIDEDSNENTNPPVEPTPPTPPITPIDPPARPHPIPKPPVDPKPPVNSNNLINNSSIIINNANSLLPSQLINLSDSSIKENLLTKNFDSNKISNVKFTLLSLDDINGTLSIQMDYSFENKKLQYTFNFNNLLKLDINKMYLISNFKKVPKNWNAYEVSKKIIKNDSEAKEFIKTINDDQISDIKLSVNSYDIPFNYLNVNGINIKNFNNTWFSENKEMKLTFELMNPKINFYKKDKSSILKKQIIDFPTSREKSFDIKFESASDFLLNKVSVDETFLSTKYPDYYIGDIKYNNGTEFDLLLSSNQLLNEYPNNLEGTNINYKVSLVKDSVSNVTEEGNFDVRIKMSILSNTVTKYSLNSKTITISNFKKYPMDVFKPINNSYNERIFTYVEPNKQDTFLTSLKRHKTNLLKDINNKPSDSLVKITSLQDSLLTVLSNSWKSSFKYQFNNDDLELININSNRYYKNDYIYIDFITPSDFELYYDRNNDCFRVYFNLSLQLNNRTVESSSKLSVPITKQNQTLEQLKK